MTNRTEIVSGLTGILNGAFVLLNATGTVQLSPEMIGGINGMLLPLALLFLGNRVNRVETQATLAAQNSNDAATQASQAKHAVQNAGRL